MDEKKDIEDPSELVLRGKGSCHSKDIISADYSHNLGLIATGSRNHKIRIWDYEKVKYEDELKGHTNEVTIVRFIPPFPLLVTCDNTGELILWRTIPHPEGNALILKWRNMFTLQKMCPITSIDSYYDEKANSLKLVIGDEMGSVRIQEIFSLIDCLKLKPIDVVEGNIKRNPWRIFKHDKTQKNKESEAKENNDSDSDHNIEIVSKEPDHNKYDKEVVQIIQWKAHKDSIRFIKFINETDFPIIFTAGMDKMARIWNIKGEPMGTLRQGAVKFPDKAWEFPLGCHEELKEDRNSKVEAMLQEVKIKRDMDVQSRKMFTKGVDKKKTITARAMDKTTQPIVSPLSKTFHKDVDYSTVTTKYNNSFYIKILIFNF